VSRLLLVCRLEEAVLTAARRGALPADLAEHAEGCARCTRAAAVGLALREAAAAFATESRVPPADLLLRLAEAERHRAHTERALRPMRWARHAAAAVGAAVTVTVVPTLLRHLPSPSFPPASSLVPAVQSVQSGSVAVVVALSALCLAALVGAVWLAWDEA
jgi:hypothetical protein